MSASVMGADTDVVRAESGATHGRAGWLVYRQPAAIVAVGLGLTAYPFVISAPFWQNVGVLAMIFAVGAAGWNLLGGFCGQISFGHAMFFGAGAYTTALAVRAGWTPWLSFALGAGIAAGTAVITGFPTLRLRGHYFTIATIAVSEICATIVLNRRQLGAAIGLTMPIKPDSLGDLQFSGRDKTPYHLVALAVFAVLSLACWLFVRGRTGAYVRAIRDDPEAAAAAGVPVRRYKLLAAAASAAVTSVAGGLYAMYVLFVDVASTLSLSTSISIVLMAVLGGAGSLWGPLIGAWALTALQQYTRVELSGSGRAADLLIYGLLIALIAVVEPAGLVGISQRLVNVARRRRR